MVMIDFHAFRMAGENFLFFPRSAKLYQLSTAAAAMLRELSCRPGRDGSTWSLQRLALAGADEPAEARGDLAELLRQELQVPSPAAHPEEDPRQGNAFHTFSVYLAQTCNMSCSYCWSRGGSFGQAPRLMTAKDAQSTSELIVSLVESLQSDRVCIKFYGGEPLLNFPALERITLELRQQEARLAKNFRFSLDTNGLLLEGATAQFLARHFSGIGVSLDGREAVHDRQRPGTCGERTWQRIVANVKAFPNQKILCLRATLTNDSDPYLETFRHLQILGVRRIHLEYCHETGYQQNPAYDQLLVSPQRQLAELRSFVDHYLEEISRYRECNEVPFVPNLMENLGRIWRGDRFTRPCGAGLNTLAIDSRGEIFPCIAFADRDDLSMGRVGTQGCLPLQPTLSPLELNERLSCHSCWLRYDCAGGCYATHYSMTGHAQQPHPEYCRKMRGKAEIYLYALARMLQECPWHLEHLKREVRCDAE
jgi:uncharacterized protein